MTGALTTKLGAKGSGLLFTFSGTALPLSASTREDESLENRFGDGGKP